MHAAPASWPRLSRARALVLVSCAAGIAAEALFRHTTVGLNFTLFIALAAVVHALFTECAAPLQRRLTAATIPVVASLPVFVFDSDWALSFAAPMSIAWLLLVPRLVEHGFSLEVFGRVPERIAEAIVRLAPAALRGARLPIETMRGERPLPLRGIALGLAIGIPSALVFMVVFSFDPQFAHALDSIGRRSNDAVSFGVTSLAFAGLLLLLVMLEEQRHRHEASAPLSERLPYRGPPVDDAVLVEATKGRRVRRELPPLAWGLVLLQVSAVFALYVALHARELFAGHARVHHTQGVTYAGELHGGFFSLLVATGLAVGLVLIGHALYDRRLATGSAARKRIMACELTLIGLTAPTLASCTQKLALYVDAYGQTYLRLGVAVAIAIAFPVLLLTAARSLHPTWRGFGAACGLLVFVVGTAASFFDADRAIAKKNVERALRGGTYDELHTKYIEDLGSQALAGFAAARPSTPAEEARWRSIIAPVVNTWDHEHTTKRGYRRITRCADALGADICATSTSTSTSTPTSTSTLASTDGGEWSGGR